jgi:hypothetical protein
MLRYSYGGQANHCDFDVLEEMPSQESFDATWFNKKPVLIRNGIAEWPARQKWQSKAAMSQMFGTDFVSQWFRSGDEHASYHLQSYFDSNNTSRTRRARKRVGDFLCFDACLPPTDGTDGHKDQVYLFDRDDWRAAAPELEADVVIPPVVARHFDPEWHTRWSKYLLLSAEGSGINFHRHSNAFNGLVAGAPKRWFLYPPWAQPPSYTLGALPWLMSIYRDDWAAPAGRQSGRDGLQQCMQLEGDLIYVPRNYWHATVALGEGVGVSGQFVRKLHEILKDISAAVSTRQYAEALRLMDIVLDHRDEVEPEVLVAVSGDSAGLKMHLGQLEAAEHTAREALSLAQQHGAGDTRKAHRVLWHLASRSHRSNPKRESVADGDATG